MTARLATLLTTIVLAAACDAADGTAMPVPTPPAAPAEDPVRPAHGPTPLEDGRQVRPPPPRTAR